MKTPKNYSTEELLNQLDSLDDTDDYVESDIQLKESKTSDVLQFIGYFKLSEGEYRVHKKYLYLLFKAYIKKPISSSSFYRLFASLYPYKSVKNFYSVNKNILNILKIAEQMSKKDKLIRSKYNPKMVNNVKSFLNCFEIGPGGFWVESFILTELYDDYRRKYNKPQYRAKNLTSAFGLFLETERTKYANFVWFKINKKALDLFDETRYNEYINQRGFEWWKNVPDEVCTTEANERKKKAKEAISLQNKMYSARYKKKKQIAEKRKNIQH